MWVRVPVCVHAEAKARGSCLPLFLSASLSWDRVSHWIGCPPFWLSPSAGVQECVATPSVFTYVLWISTQVLLFTEQSFFPAEPSSHSFSVVSNDRLALSLVFPHLICPHYCETFQFPAMLFGQSLPSVPRSHSLSSWLELWVLKRQPPLQGADITVLSSAKTSDFDLQPFCCSRSRSGLHSFKPLCVHWTH